VIDGCAAQGISIGANCRASTVIANIRGVAGVGVNEVDGIAAPNTPEANTYVISTKGCGSQSCIVGGTQGMWTINTDKDGRSGAQGSSFAVDVKSGGTYNQLTVNLTDTTTWQVRGIVFRSGADNNKVISFAYSNTADPYNDSGSGNEWIAQPASWVNASFASGWSNGYGGSFATVGYYKNGSGLVFLRGNPSGSGTGTMFTLPAGYRPSGDLYFPSVSPSDLSGQRIKITTAGLVQLDGATNFTTSISHISFPVN
jgi:hypothetical protein